MTTASYFAEHFDTVLEEHLAAVREAYTNAKDSFLEKVAESARATPPLWDPIENPVTEREQRLLLRSFMEDPSNELWRCI